MTLSLEEHIAHQDAALDDISKQMADQWAAIRRLERQLDRVLDHFKSMEDAMPSAPSDAPPPHY